MPIITVSRSKLVPTKAHVESDVNLRQHERYDVK